MQKAGVKLNALTRVAWMNEYRNEWMNEWMNEWNEWMNEMKWMNEMNEWMNEYRKKRSIMNAFFRRNLIIFPDVPK